MRYSVAAAALSVVMTLGACQDDGPETSSLTKAEFLEEADAICADFADQLAARTETPSAPADDDASAVSIRDEVLSLATSYEEVVANIRAIGFPEDEAEALNGMFGELASAIDELGTKAEDIDPAAGPDGLITVSATMQKLTEALSVLRTYGFDHCTTA